MSYNYSNSNETEKKNNALLGSEESIISMFLTLLLLRCLYYMLDK